MVLHILINLEISLLSDFVLPVHLCLFEPQYDLSAVLASLVMNTITYRLTYYLLT